MIGGPDVDRSPEEIESQIAQTRASLDRTLREIERRLSPSAQVQRLKQSVDPDTYYAWGAVAAIAAGAWLAIRGWRRTNGHALSCDEVDLILDDMPFE